MGQSLNNGNKTQKMLSDNTFWLLLNTLLACFFISEEGNTTSSFAKENNIETTPGKRNQKRRELKVREVVESDDIPGKQKIERIIETDGKQRLQRIEDFNEAEDQEGLVTKSTVSKGGGKLQLNIEANAMKGKNELSENEREYKEKEEIKSLRQEESYVKDCFLGSRIP